MKEAGPERLKDERENPSFRDVWTQEETSNMYLPTHKGVLCDWESRNLCVSLGARAPKNWPLFRLGPRTKGDEFCPGCLKALSHVIIGVIII